MVTGGGKDEEGSRILTVAAKGRKRKILLQVVIT